MVMLRKMSCIGIVVVSAAWISACSGPEKVSQSPPIPSKEHWVHDSELRELMSKLVLEQPWPERLDSKEIGRDRPESERVLRDAKKLGDALVRAAVTIPSLVVDVKMTEADRRAFEAQALTLRDQARALKRVANHGDVRAVHDVLMFIDSTCSTCHTRFRDFSGLLGPQQSNRDVGAKLRALRG